MSENPYEAPAARVDDPVEGDDEATRRPLLKHEASLRSVAWLYWLGMLLFGSLGIGLVVQMAGTDLPPDAELGTAFWVMGVIYLGLAIAFAATGWGFRTLAPWVRIPGGLFSALGLLGIPIGTLINGYVLWLMFGAKGRRILTDEYATIRRRTPHLVYRRSTAEKVGIVLILGVPALIIAWMIWGR